jgi:hypothetical protein
MQLLSPAYTIGSPQSESIRMLLATYRILSNNFNRNSEIIRYQISTQTTIKKKVSQLVEYDYGKFVFCPHKL